jgi:hypothetical protein
MRNIWLKTDKENGGVHEEPIGIFFKKNEPPARIFLKKKKKRKRKKKTEETGCQCPGRTQLLAVGDDRLPAERLGDFGCVDLPRPLDQRRGAARLKIPRLGLKSRGGAGVFNKHVDGNFREVASLELNFTSMMVLLLLFVLK